ncbi:MAG: hypothetical protein ACLPPF_00930 [Rhodomicrobium sp.]
MFFFFPFAAEPASAPASREVPQVRSLPTLSALPGSRNEARPKTGNGVNVFSDAVQAAVDLLRRAIGSLTASFTALGSRTSALFAQLSANFAFDRAARDMASSFGLSWPGFGLQNPLSGFERNLWSAPAQNPASPFGFPALAMIPLAGNPFSVFTEAVDMWTNLWMPAATPKRPAVPAPATATVAFPGGSWSFTWG